MAIHRLLASLVIVAVGPVPSINPSMPVSLQSLLRITDTCTMRSTVYERFSSDEVTDKMLEEASELFSEHYGVWAKQAEQVEGPHGKAGEHVRLSKERLRKEHLPGDTSLYVRVTVDGRLAGNALAARWTANGRRICWVSQLVIHRDYRGFGLATGLLKQLKVDGDDVYGIASCHPAHILAFAKAFGSCIHTVSLDFIKQNAASIMKTSPVEYIRDAKLRGSLFDPSDKTGLVSGIDTRFFVDHKEPLEALAWVKKNREWPLGEMLEGDEFLLIVEATRPQASR
ncbi:uncharacterized protein EI97DRAFT_497676 [Westerdykella ornata]|uniref:N-acetyltransferase domain-containing protein n=1 Tax=Westerdykella ornata TaxID=318751 RepID=A0A6A6K0U6_WESOR|nr:uncharacterized protein EI97DRAFT_497676 [Westerdykella ornata]KAF2280959.1 hypothetical protein EI97DRAFT_497676 [Westerdykella ornata]